VLLAHRTPHCCLGGKEHTSLVECLQSWIPVGNTFPCHFERLSLGSQEKGLPDIGTHSHLGTNALWYGKTQIHFYVLLSLSTNSIDLTPLNLDMLGPDFQQLVLPVCQAIWTFR
uniref:Uncharacterized protein n=1 Tax=Marmota marmota marmota TaxID=9994 RepID=A0A8C5ZCQ1_MARMA